MIDDWLGTAVNVAETEHKGQADLKIHAMRKSYETLSSLVTRVDRGSLDTLPRETSRS